MNVQRKQYYVLHGILYIYCDVNKISHNRDSACVVDVGQHWKMFEKNLSLHGYLDPIIVYCWYKNMAHYTS